MDAGAVRCHRRWCRTQRVDLCLFYLAKAGLKVLVLERYRDISSMTLTEELTLPGFRSDVHASGYQLANLPPVPGELELAKHGLEIIEPDIVYAHAFPDGRVLAVSRDLARTVQNIERYSKKDAETCRGLFERYRAQKDKIVTSLFAAPPTFSEAAVTLEHSPGGMHNVSRDLADYLRSQGGEIRINAGVERILVDERRAVRRYPSANW